MKDNWIKSVIKKTLFPQGAVRPILWGALRGKKYRVSPVTGLSPVYSGVEKRQVEYFKKYIEPGDCVIDVFHEANALRNTAGQ